MPLDRTGPIEQFRLPVEQLEVCRDLILVGTPTKARIALILLDNVAEIILFRLSERSLSSDAFLKWIKPERLSMKEKRILDRVFKAKVELARSEHYIKAPMAIILNILHFYRNAAFHRDTHNPAVVTILARVAFRAVLDFFAQTRAGIALSSSGGHDEAETEWLTRYGLEKGFIDYENAANVIAKQLKIKGRRNLNAVRESFISDINYRITAIRQLINEELPWKSPEELNTILKWFEFKDAEPELEDRLSKHYRGLIYKIAASKKVNTKPDELHILELKFRAEYEKRLETYQQHISFDSIGLIEARIKELSEAVNLSSLLKSYYEIDSTLSTVELYLYLALSEWDEWVQLQTDIMMGK